MISNPIQGGYFCPAEKRMMYLKYKYNPIFSKKAYNFQPADCGLSSSREANLLFFAMTETHALKRLKLMFEWYLENNLSRENRRKQVQHWLDNFDKIHVVEVPLNQFFLVGWAENDTLL